MRRRKLNPEDAVSAAVERYAADVEKKLLHELHVTLFYDAGKGHLYAESDLNCELMKPFSLTDEIGHLIRACGEKKDQDAEDVKALNDWADYLEKQANRLRKAAKVT